MRRFNCLLAVPLFVWGAAGSVPVECILSVNFLTSAHAQSQPPAAQQGAREVPSRAIPVPDTVSPQMQAVIARPFDPSFNLVPQTTAEWKARVEKVALATVAGLPKLREALGVAVQPSTMAGVKVFIVTPKSIAPQNRDRVLMHLHGGVRVFGPGESGTREAILMAGFGGFKVISVDYRMPPDFPFPAALDDAVAVYRNLLQTVDAKNVGIFGASGGRQSDDHHVVAGQDGGFADAWCYRAGHADGGSDQDRRYLVHQCNGR